MLSRALALCLLLCAGAAPALAQSSTGGSLNALNVSAIPGMTCTAGSGASRTMTCSLTGLTKDETGAAYTASCADAGYWVKVGASSGTPTLTVPVSGGAGCAAGTELTYVNAGSVTVPVVVNTGTFDGAGGSSSFNLATGANFSARAESDGNWLVLLSQAGTISSPGPQLVQHIAGPPCFTNSSNSTLSCTITATGSGGHALTVLVGSCLNSSCNATGSGGSFSVTAPSGCSAISGTASSGGNYVTAGFVCANVASGVTTVTVSSSLSSTYYLQADVEEWSNVPTSSVTEAAGNAVNNSTGTSFTCTTGSTTNPQDVIFAALYNGSGATPNSPFTQIDPGSTGYGTASYSPGSTGTFTTTWTSGTSYSYNALCFGIK